MKLNKDEKTLIAFELYDSINEAIEIKNKAQKYNIENQIKNDKNCASLEEINEYIQKRKELLEKIGMPYYKLKNSVKIEDMN